MLSRQLESALAAFAEEAAWQLASDMAEGAEVPYEVDEHSGGGYFDTPLYCYRPLTGAFIDERTSLIGRLPTYLPAVHALEGCGGLDAYLVARGESQIPRDPRLRAEEVLRLFLCRCFADSTDFVLTPERLHTAVRELDREGFEGRDPVAEVVAVLHGLALCGDEVALGDGLALTAPEPHDDDLPREALAGGDDPGVLMRLTWEAAPGDEAPLSHAHVRLRRVLTSLRLYDATVVTLGRTAWARTGAGTWQPFALGAGGGATRGTLVVPAQQEDELRAFCALVARRTPRRGPIAWALRRFELAIDSPSPAEALTDALLALRALLEPEGAHSGRLAARVAALCAVPETQALVTERVAHAIALERAVVGGVGPDAAALGPIVDELVGCLRALLRDVLCGHLEPDLRALADRLLAEAAADDPEGRLRSEVRSGGELPDD